MRSWWMCWVSVASAFLGMAHASVLPGPLVTTEWLAANASKVTILDIREDAAEYLGSPQGSRLAGHIPGARLVEAAKIRQTRQIDGRRIPAMVPDADVIEELMRSSGVDADEPIVIVAPGRTVEEFDGAARLYWTLKYYGARELSILDGGYARWVEEARPIEETAPMLARGTWSAGEPRRDLLADTAAVIEANATGVQLVDARPLAFFHGLAKRPVVAEYGHIPGARVFPTELRARSEGMGQRYLTLSDYRALLRSLQIDADRPTIAYCNTGHMGAGVWFILSELLHQPHVSLYDGSMAEWADGKRPVVRY